MKKTFLLCAVALFPLMVSGSGLPAVGANAVLLPSSYFDGDIPWSAWTWVYNSGLYFGYTSESSPNYNLFLGEPAPDAEGRMWYEPGYDMSPKEEDLNTYLLDEYDQPTPIVWEEHDAPFSSASVFNGQISYQWTTDNVIADIYFRRTFTIDPSMELTAPVYLRK